MLISQWAKEHYYATALFCFQMHNFTMLAILFPYFVTVLSNMLMKWKWQKIGMSESSGKKNAKVIF